MDDTEKKKKKQQKKQTKNREKVRDRGQDIVETQRDVLH